MDAKHAASLGRRYLIQFKTSSGGGPLWIWHIIEVPGRFVLMTLAGRVG